MRVGLTFFLRKEGGSIWANGATQNCVFLLRLLRAAGHEVFAVNGGDGNAASPGMMLKGLDIEFVKASDVRDSLDVLIEAEAQISAEDAAHVRTRGGRVVAYRFGNAFVIDAERMIHDKKPGSIFNGTCFDEVWTNPQHMATCASYWETCYRCPVRELPHIWEPIFVDAAAAEMTGDLSFGYRTGSVKKRIGVLEPNINIVKTAVLPLCIIERAYRRTPKLVGDVMVANSLALKDHLSFQHFASALDVVRDGVASFEGRFNTPYFLAKYVDVVVAHQWENALNYAYYDALHGGYPLIHNSAMLPKGVGYFYQGFDAREGGDLLSAVLSQHDNSAGDYDTRASTYLATVNALAPANIASYSQALIGLFQERRPYAC